MLDVMFEVPSRDDLDSVTISKEVVEGTKEPVLRKKRRAA
jgi:ATP-dependent protease Clp ATPase subunit